MNESLGTILTTAIAAGKKESDNSFTGVMAGSWGGTDSNKSITEHTGIYGFHHGAMSYALKDDGTAFFGKSGEGRINIDGNKATLYSPAYQGNNPNGMKIDLGGDNTPFIDLKNGSNSITLGFSGTTENSNPYLHINSSLSQFSYPLAIGENFYIDWEGQLTAVSGKFKGTIYGSKLESTSSSGRIILDGYLEESEGGYIGKIESNLPGAENDNNTLLYGIGMAASRKLINTGIVKATLKNAGLAFGNSYVTVQENSASMGRINGGQFTIGLENSGNTATQLIAGKYRFYITSGDYLFCDISAANQHGIYARFA